MFAPPKRRRRPQRHNPRSRTKGTSPMCERKYHRSTVRPSPNSLPFDPDPSCVIDFGLHAVACDARFALQT